MKNTENLDRETRVSGQEYTPDKSLLITLLRLIGRFLPGDYLKTAFYLNAIQRRRKLLSEAIKTRTVFDRLISYIPNGCAIYFDDYEFNYGSRFTGEARLVDEINRGMLCDDIELVLDRNLSLLSERVWRFIRLNAHFQYKRVAPSNWREQVHLRSNDSALP